MVGTTGFVEPSSGRLSPLAKSAAASGAGGNQHNRIQAPHGNYGLRMVGTTGFVEPSSGRLSPLAKSAAASGAGGNQRNRIQAPHGNYGLRMVGTTGFEPATSRTPSVRATRLRHVPTACCRNSSVSLAFEQGQDCNHFF